MRPNMLLARSHRTRRLLLRSTNDMQHPWPFTRFTFPNDANCVLLCTWTRSLVGKEPSPPYIRLGALLLSLAQFLFKKIAVSIWNTFSQGVSSHLIHRTLSHQRFTHVFPSSHITDVTSMKTVNPLGIFQATCYISFPCRLHPLRTVRQDLLTSHLPLVVTEPLCEGATVPSAAACASTDWQRNKQHINLFSHLLPTHCAMASTTSFHQPSSSSMILG